MACVTEPLVAGFNNLKIPKNSDTRKIAVMILKIEECGSTIE